MTKQGTLLVVDDNRNILTSLQYLLNEYFERVLTLSSPVTIPTLMRKEDIHVVLLDMNFSSGIHSGMKDCTGSVKSRESSLRHRSYSLRLMQTSTWL